MSKPRGLRPRGKKDADRNWQDTFQIAQTLEEQILQATVTTQAQTLKHPEITKNSTN